MVSWSFLVFSWIIVTLITMFPGEHANVYPKLSGIKVAERLMRRKFKFMQIFAGIWI